MLTEWETEIYQQPVLVDVNGDAVMNSAGDYFLDPLPTRDASRLIVKIKANVTSVPAWLLEEGNNAVNNAGIAVDGVTFPEQTVKTSRVRVGQRLYRFGLKFYPLSYELHYRKEGWKLEPLDAGFRARNGQNEIIQITNDDGSEITSPAPLDGSGGVLTNPTPTSAVFQEFDIYNEHDLTILPGIEAAP